MRGLLEKDFCLLLKKLKHLLILVAVFFWCGILMEGAFIVTYAPIIVTLLVMSTIGSDEADNGMAFLMTLPCAPSDYAKEKYALNTFFGIITSALVIIVKIVASMVQGSGDTILDCVCAGMITIPIWVLLMAILIPINLKFGNSKGQIVMFVIFAVMMATILFGAKLLESMGFDSTELLNKVATTPAWILCSILAVFTACALLISIMVSVKIMNNKEY